MKRIVFPSIICLLLCCCHSQSQIARHKQLPMLSVTNTELLSLIDKSVHFFDNIEDKTDSLFFSIDVHKRHEKDDAYTLQISSEENWMSIFNGIEDPIGFFYYYGYLFVVYNKESERFFSTTNSNKSFPCEPSIKNKLLIIDNGLPYWDYIFFDNQFIPSGESIPLKFKKVNAPNSPSFEQIHQ